MNKGPRTSVHCKSVRLGELKGRTCEKHDRIEHRNPLKNIIEYCMEIVLIKQS